MIFTTPLLSQQQDSTRAELLHRLRAEKLAKIKSNQDTFSLGFFEKLLLKLEQDNKSLTESTSFFSIRPDAGSISPSSGIGLGFSSKFEPSENLELKFRARINHHLFYSGQLSLDYTILNPLRILIYGRQQFNPDIPFFADPSSNKFTNLTERRIVYGSLLAISMPFGITLLAESAKEHFFISRLKPDFYKPAIFTIRTGIFFDWRDQHPTKTKLRPLAHMSRTVGKQWETTNAGGFFRFDYKYHQRTDTTANYYSLRTEIAQTIPIILGHRSIAFRALGIFHPAGLGEENSFLQPHLGGGYTLRSYEVLRFRANNVLHATLEYRYRIHFGIETAIFVDAGKVFDNQDEWASEKLRFSSGMGFRLSTKHLTFIRTDVAYGSEGFGIKIKFGNVF